MIGKYFSSLVASLAGNAPQADQPGMAHPWQIGFQQAATPVMEKLEWLHNDFLLYIITAIAVFVLALTLYICARFNRRVHPTPSGRIHNTPLEIVWTVVPVIILVAIAIPSLRIHYYVQRVIDPEMTIKALGHQWYWSYEYPDQGGIAFDSYMVKDDALKPGQPRLLTVDNPVVVPVDTKVRVQLTGADVIHSWAVPAFGVKKDAVPGRLNETWFKAERVGTYYGQCSELCGVGHGFMPIEVHVVSKADFATWVKEQQKAQGISSTPSPEDKAAGSPETQAAAPSAASAPAGQPAKKNAVEKKSGAATVPLPKKPAAEPADEGE